VEKNTHTYTVLWLLYFFLLLLGLMAMQLNEDEIY